MATITKEVKLDPSVIPPLDASLLTLTEDESEFLHSSITNDDAELKARILEVQKEAYKEHPYPCIRAFHFVNLFMAVNPIYPEVLAAGKAGDTLFIDLGCCMGTDVRKLVADGYPAARVLGCDLRQSFLDFGYELFRDEDTCGIHFFPSDVFEVPYPGDSTPAPSIDVADVSDIVQLRGAVTHFYTGALFHLFDEQTQYALALRVAMLLKRAPGTVVFGRHQGLQEAGMIDDHMYRVRYGHSVASWPEMWKKVFAEVESPEFAETRIVVQAKLTEGFHRKQLGARRQTNMLVWSVKIV
ncbi:hypothetical protein PHLGIDRAFT_126378 [Phlebiopsis gigantea 11061_1 CR5-6]|uniref:Methyltransferase domain-containing protein n=1 Tax=Phlebiopsis gigantea (strain 11061_1 CR5-6) TaxID=745531 RepID=A0A0C3PQI9_PHLG1|nr:hypothetical protein PHLGIDRAFT_126378 [Phlebiopsis gigantea 11061_1 CR5-6]